MQTITCRTHGLTREALQSVATLVCEDGTLGSEVISKCISGIKRFPIEDEWKRHLQTTVKEQAKEKPSLWKVSEPVVIVYRWPNGELKYFMVSSDGHLFESPEGVHFMKYFNWIETGADEVFLRLNNAKSLGVGGKMKWMPQNRNYSHFLLDSFAPALTGEDDCIDYIDSQSHKVLTVEPWLGWQKEFLKHTRLAYTKAADIEAGQIGLFFPEEVLMPVMLSKLHAQLTLRDRVNIWHDKKGSKGFCADIPVLFLRRDDLLGQKRIRNHAEISEMVAENGGISVDATRLGLREKRDLICRAKVVIGDGSASVNATLFLNEDSTYVGLTDASTINNIDFIMGGFPYALSICDRMISVVGKDPEIIHGSALKSCYYPLDAIRVAIEERT
jgi:hypothetical protein